MRRLPLLIACCVFFASCRDMVEDEADEKFALAESALHQGDWAAADESFHETILLDPDRADAWVGRGMTLTRLGEEESARKHYEEALLIYVKRSESEPYRGKGPVDFGPIHHRIMLLVLLDRAEEAKALAEETVANHPDEPSAQALSGLADKVHSEFQDMILVAEDEDEEVSPIFNDDDLTGTP